MKKKLLKTKGEFVLGVFIPKLIHVPKGAVNVNDEPVAEGWAEYTENDGGCNGVAKPAPKEGQTGDWFCVANEWVWFPG